MRAWADPKTAIHFKKKREPKAARRAWLRSLKELEHALNDRTLKARRLGD
jgi:hypothetical protein